MRKEHQEDGGEDNPWWQYGQGHWEWSREEPTITHGPRGRRHKRPRRLRESRSTPERTTPRDLKGSGREPVQEPQGGTAGRPPERPSPREEGSEERGPNPIEEKRPDERSGTYQEGDGEGQREEKIEPKNPTPTRKNERQIPTPDPAQSHEEAKTARSSGKIEEMERKLGQLEALFKMAAKAAKGGQE